MAYTVTQARKLLTATELTLFESSRTPALRELSAARLRAKVVRSRTLRDKYRDLYRRQTVGMRGAPSRQRSPVGADNQRTQHKADLFDELLKRFEDRLQTVERAAAGQQAGATNAARTSSAKKAAGTGRAATKRTTTNAPASTAASRSTAGKRGAGAPTGRTAAKAARSR